MRVDEQELSNRYKIGVLYCKAGQTSEEDWYNNGESHIGRVSMANFSETTPNA